MRRKKIIAWVFVIAIIFTMCNLESKTASASTDNMIGGKAENGCLRVKVTEGNINIERYNGTGWIKQYYAPSDTVLNINGTLYETGTYYGEWAHGAFSGTKIPVATQVSDDKSIITTWQTGQLRITQKLTLASTEAQYIKMVWLIENTGSTSWNNLHFLRGEDTYLAGGDNGCGYWNAATNSVGVYKTISGVLQRLYLQGITEPNSYTSKAYDSVVLEVAAGGALSKTIASDDIDNGYAMEWKRDTLDAGDTWTIRAIESFVSSSITGGNLSNVVISADATGTITMPFDVTNSSSSAQDVSYSVEGPAGWTVVPERSGDTIGANQSKTLNIQVTPPEDVENGDYEIVLDMGTSSGETQAIGIITIARPPKAPEIEADDDNNILVGADNTMEYSTDGGITWTSYDINNVVVFDGEATVLVRVEADTGIPAGEITTVSFTKNTPKAPEVSADDDNNKIIGADDTMEYSTDDGVTWTAYDSSNEPVFDGAVTVQVRKKETEKTLTGEKTTVSFTKNTPKAPEVGADDDNNKITGADDTMEYSTDDGVTWTAYDSSNEPVFDGAVTVQVRKKETEKTLTGEKTTVSFTKNMPKAPEVGADDDNNKITGADDTMEYSTDDGVTWTVYDSSNEPVFDGAVTVQVRKKETEKTLAGEKIEVVFTKNTQKAPAVIPNDVNNKLIGLNSTMEYSTDAGVTWVTYNSGNEPVFDGDVTVLIRKKETPVYAAGEVTTVTFTENPKLPEAPAVIIDDSNNKISGLDSTMEYSTDGGMTWESYDDTNKPVFNGGVTVQLRKKAGEMVAIDYSAKTATGSAISVVSGSVISVVSGSAVSAVTGAALTADFTSNRLGGADETMEYSTDGGVTWNDVDNSVLDFNEDTKVLLRKKAGEITTVTFTKNPQTAPSVIADDVNNKIIGLDSTMEYSTDAGVTWVTYDNGNEPVFNGNITVLIRKKETPAYMAGEVTTVTFTENPKLPEAPAVIIDDSNNEISGLDSTMEYSTDGGMTWESYDDINKPVFNGGVAVQLRKKAGEMVVIDYSAKTVTGSAISVVSGSAVSAVTGAALTADFTNNRLGGADETMEYSTDGGVTWNDVDNSVLDFNEDTKVLLRKKAGEITTVTFTKNPQTAPSVIADDVNNKIIGLNSTMEYSTDAGVTWVTYDNGNEPVFNGNITVLIRKKETPAYMAGEVTTVTFTENPKLPEAPAVIIDDSNNEISGLDSTMEYSTDGGMTWESYDDINKPVFNGGVAVQLRKKAGEMVVIDYSAKTVTGSAISVVSGSAVSAVTGAALTADFTNNRLGGADETMEYSTDGGMTWNDVQNNILDFNDETKLLIRNKAGDITTVTFTKNPQAEPKVVVDDKDNIINGLDNTMEYSTDEGITWITCSSGSEPVFSGNVTVWVRKKETSDYSAGKITTISFTSNPPDAPAIVVDDNSNHLVGADATMEYSMDGGNSWTDYDPSNEPEFSGNVTVQIRTKASTGTPAGVITTVSFSQNASAAVTTGSKSVQEEVRKVNVNRVSEEDTSAVATVDIIRRVSDGQKVDSVILDREKIKEALNKKQNSEYLQLVIDDIPEDKSDELNVTINKASVKELAENASAFEVKTDDVRVRLPEKTVSALAKEEKDLYFRFIPIRDEEKLKEVRKNTVKAEVVRQAAGNNAVSVLGTPMTIETNYKDCTTTLLFSLNNLTIPEEEAARREFLDSLAVYIQHSDGDQEVNRGAIVYDENGVPTDLEVEISKFSIFTIISISNQAPTATNALIKGKAVVGKTLKAAYTYSDEEGDLQGESLIKWYRADSRSGKNKMLIKEANTVNYKVTKADQNKYLIVEITPIAKTGKITGEEKTAFIKVAAYNEAPQAKHIKIKGSMAVGAILTASYTYMDAEKDAEGKSIYQWYRSDTASGKNHAIKGANKLTYTLTDKDDKKYITFKVTPIAKKGSVKGQKISCTSKKIVQINYGCQVKLGLIGSGPYANKVADIFDKDYDVSNVRVEPEGRYYRVYMDFTSKMAARASCKDMIAREYIINYYFIK